MRLSSSHGARRGLRASLARLARLAAVATAAVAGIAMAAELSARDAAAAAAGADPLAAAIERAAEIVRTQLAGEQAQRSAAALERAQVAFRQGNRNLALQRFAPLFVDLVSAGWMRQATSGASDAAALERAWAEQGKLLEASAPGASAPEAVTGLRPAAVRALAEAAWLQERGFYHASLPYGRATEPQAGFYYLGSAAGQQALLDLLQGLSEPDAGRLPPLRSIAPEIAALEDEMLGLYRPPASTERHGQFIIASSALKEARELDEAGLHFGALLRYLQASLQVPGLRPATKVPPAAEIRSRLDAHTAELGGEVDHTLARIFLESARMDLAAAGDRGEPAVAAAIAGDVLPRYLAAIGPPPPAPPESRPAAPSLASQVAVTVVRWPYT